MPNKDGTGPKGQGPKDGHGKGKGGATCADRDETEFSNQMSIE